MAAAEIAHRDLKPENWFVKYDGAPSVYIGDLDRATNQRFSSQAYTGTFGFQSLEFMIGPHWNTLKGDVFAAAMSMLEVLFVPRLAAGVKWPFIKLWRAILDQRTRVSPEHPWTLEATDIEKVLLGEEFAAFLPGMTEALASVFAKAMCAQKNRYTAKEFKDALLPLLPLQLEAEEC